jgi:hypothetical protein
MLEAQSLSQGHGRVFHLQAGIDDVTGQDRWFMASGGALLGG